MALSRVTSTTSTGSTITCPTCQDGDLLVLFDWGEDGSTPAEVVPTDFTKAYGFSSGTAPRPRGVISFRAVGPGEGATLSGSTITGVNGGTSNWKALQLFRDSAGAISSVQVAVSSPATNTATGDPADIVVPANGQPSPGIIVASYYAGSGTVSPRTMSPAKTGEQTVDGDTYCAWKLYDSSPADVTVGMDDEGSLNIVGGAYLHFKVGRMATAGITEAGDTVSATGTVALKATLAKTEAADTVSSAATLALKATLTKTEATDTVSATGTVALKATAGITEAGDTVSATGKVALKAMLSVTEASDTVSANISLPRFAEFSAAEDADTTYATGYSYVIPGWHPRETQDQDVEAWTSAVNEAEAWAERAQQSETWTRR